MAYSEIFNDGTEVGGKSSGKKRRRFDKPFVRKSLNTTGYDKSFMTHSPSKMPKMYRDLFDGKRSYAETRQLLMSR